MTLDWESTDKTLWPSKLFKHVSDNEPCLLLVDIYRSDLCNASCAAARWQIHRAQVVVGHLLKCRMGPTADSSGILSEGSLATMGSKCLLEEVAEGGKRIKKKNEINE